MCVGSGICKRDIRSNQRDESSSSIWGGVLSFLSVVKPGKCMLLFVVSLDSCIVAICMLFCLRKCFSSCSLFLIPFMFICKMFNLCVVVELFG